MTAAVIQFKRADHSIASTQPSPQQSMASAQTAVTSSGFNLRHLEDASTPQSGRQTVGGGGGHSSSSNDNNQSNLCFNLQTTAARTPPSVQPEPRQESNCATQSSQSSSSSSSPSSSSSSSSSSSYSCQTLAASGAADLHAKQDHRSKVSNSKGPANKRRLSCAGESHLQHKPTRAAAAVANSDNHNIENCFQSNSIGIAPNWTSSGDANTNKTSTSSKPPPLRQVNHASSAKSPHSSASSQVGKFSSANRAASLTSVSAASSSRRPARLIARPAGPQGSGVKLQPPSSVTNSRLRQGALFARRQLHLLPGQALTSGSPAAAAGHRADNLRRFDSAAIVSHRPVAAAWRDIVRPVTGARAAKPAAVVSSLAGGIAQSLPGAKSSTGGGAERPISAYRVRSSTLVATKTTITTKTATTSGCSKQRIKSAGSSAATTATEARRRAARAPIRTRTRSHHLLDPSSSANKNSQPLAATTATHTATTTTSTSFKSNSSNLASSSSSLSLNAIVKRPRQQQHSSSSSSSSSSSAAVSDVRCDHPLEKDCFCCRVQRRRWSSLDSGNSGRAPGPSSTSASLILSPSASSSSSSRQSSTQLATPPPPPTTTAPISFVAAEAAADKLKPLIGDDGTCEGRQTSGAVEPPPVGQLERRSRSSSADNSVRTTVDASRRRPVVTPPDKSVCKQYAPTTTKEGPSLDLLHSSSPAAIWPSAVTNPAPVQETTMTTATTSQQSAPLAPPTPTTISQDTATQVPKVSNLVAKSQPLGNHQSINIDHSHQQQLQLQLKQQQRPPAATTIINVATGAIQKTDITIKMEPICNYYDLETRPFARGKFAQVKRCTKKDTNDFYAAKCIKKRRRLVDIRHEILLEIEALKLSYETKHIVRLYEVFETPNELILILEMANGGELQRVLDDEECIDEPVVRKMIGQILEGLIYLHDNHIAHLDIKPQNILLSEPFPNGDIKLCDFGISRRITKDCEIRDICGTPDYVAPEILRYDPISLATDMWSLGVLTYVLLSGYSPFGSENKQQTFCNITQATLDFPDEIFGKVSEDAIDFIRKLVVREPTGRLTSRQARDHHWISQ